MPSASQAHRQIAVGTPLGEDKLLLRSFTYTEQLARPFEMTLDMISDTSNIKFSDIVGQNVTVRLQKPADDQPRYFNGIVRQFTQMPGSGRTTQYRAVVVPWLWLLTRTSDCRIFQDMTVPQIIMKVFHDHGMSDVDDRHHATYRKWEYCVQYRETDFDFVSRLMEQEGLYYFFTHENGKHKMVLVDSKAAHEPFPGYERIGYRPPVGQFRDKEHIHELKISQEIQPGTYAHTDYDFKSPKKDLLTESKIQRPHASSDFEVFDYPGVFVEHGDGETYSRMRIEELHTQFEVADCKTNARGIATGCKFTLADHPREDLNQDYLVVDTTVTASSDEYDSAPVGGTKAGTTFQCEFSCISFENQFRPARTTDKPMIRGPQTAVVAGPAGEEIYTDKYGRVKVQFRWDRYSKADENSSCWVRVSQPVAGKKWGSVSLPRIGQEVIVEFLEGDPDRPIITGRVYNGEAMPPYELPAHATMTSIKSNSSKGGAGFNEIRMEDKKGSEQIFVHAEKNQDTRVKNDAFEWIGNNRHLVVKKDQLEHVLNNRSEVVDADHMEQIGKDRHLKVKGKEAKEVVGSQSLKVTGDVAEEFGASHSEKATMNYYLKAMQIVLEADVGITLKVGSNSVVIDNTGVTAKGTLVTLDGTMTNINSGPGSPPASGSLASRVPATAPTQAEDADNADPGQVEQVVARQRQTQMGKYGAAQVTPHKPPQSEEEKAAHPSWVEIVLVDQQDKPVAGERYKVTLPDGKTVAEGTLDGNGFARVAGIDPGTCKITFPGLDQDAWEKA
jgi:type VI secretion system secreted protein VgrG